MKTLIWTVIEVLLLGRSEIELEQETCSQENNVYQLMVAAEVTYG